MRASPSLDKQSLIRRYLLFLTFALVGFVTLTEPAAASNVAKLGRECHEGKQKACDEIAKLATQSKNYNVRIEAVGLLEDQSLLIKIALQARDLGVRRAAVARFNESSALQMVTSATAEDVALDEALERLKTPPVLFQAAMAANLPKIRKQAADRLTDPSLLSRLALESTDATIRSGAVNQLTDEKSLEAVATASKDAAMQTVAVWKLTDPDVLQLLATKASDEPVRKAALAALDVKTAQGEREVYVWKAPVDYATDASRPRWRISGILGAADLGLMTVGLDQTDNALPMNARGAVAISSLLTSVHELSVNPEKAGFVPWWFKPESDQDHCFLESGKFPMGGAANQSDLSGPFAFTGSVAKGTEVWEVKIGITTVFFQPTLHVNRSGVLALAGSVAVLTNPGTPGMFSWSTNNLQDAAVLVVGTIRYPKGRWTAAGGGYEVLEGGLQFDETGVFLMPGTKYRKHGQ